MRAKYEVRITVILYKVYAMMSNWSVFQLYKWLSPYA